MKLRSPAKINLFLRILRRRPDGYHELASLFQAISLFDTLDFTLAERDQLTCSDPTLPTDSSNLVLKAANLFRRKTGLNFGLHVHLDKKIPHQAGLGGGSGNAATTLWALNQLHNYPANPETLVQWAGEIGSDVAFFLSSGTAYCTGRGEIVQSLQPLHPQTIWIVKPSQGTSTPAVYGRLDATRLPQRDPELALNQFLAGSPCYFNDLEEAALLVTPKLAALKSHLMSQGYPDVMLSGSGSSFFCAGAAMRPVIPGCEIYAVEFANRTSDNWY
ncbi:MAG: 4-(cytidine 5'-diphospho)-2-C-methyl-D-erythritol kinase [Parachlamydia sp.]|nr:4-(cytidine 5'-diphospho)-2-C-methyl-D-erythritol kinase [Parachlamydia sp.]